MSRSPKNASNSKNQTRQEAGPLDLVTTLKMLPLVKSIVNDIRAHSTRLHQLTPEQEGLERNRRGLVWAERDRRYKITEEITQTEKNLSTAVSELDALGVELIDPENGVVDFPTRINGRSAAFSWQVGEEAVQHWHYVGEGQRRPIPADWMQKPTRA
jgi:hypothetical protein